MTTPQKQQLAQLLKTPPYAGKSDAEAAAMASTPVRTPHPYRITFASIGALLGGSRAASFRAGLKAAAGSGQQPIAAMADYVLALLDGPGFDPSNADVATFAAGFVAANLCTADEANTILYASVVKPFGDVTEADVAAARLLDEKQADYMARSLRNSTKWNTYIAALDAWRLGGFEGDAPADI